MTTESRNSQGAVILDSSKSIARRKFELSKPKQQELFEIGDACAVMPAGPDNGLVSYMANILVRLTMPHRAVRNEDGTEKYTFSRKFKNMSITIQANPHVGLPFGSVPRLLMSFITSEALRTKEPRIILGSSLRDFMLKLGYTSISGGQRGSATVLKGQLKRLFASNISVYDEHRSDSFGVANMVVAKKAVLCWDQRNSEEFGFFDSTVDLSADFFDEIIRNPVPLDMRALQAFSHSPMCLDIYSWLTYRMSHVYTRETENWKSLQEQFGAGYPQTAEGLRDFRTAFRGHMATVLSVYRSAKVNLEHKDHIVLLPSPTHVPKTTSVVTTLDRISRGSKSV